MRQELQNTIKEELSKLTPDIQSAIASVDWVKISEEIGKKNNLTDEDINDMQVETLLVLTGVEELKNYAKNLEIQNDLTKEESISIAKEMIEKVFNPIQKILEEVVKKNIEKNGSKWDQSINFILSGGNYAVYMQQKEYLKDNKPQK